MSPVESAFVDVVELSVRGGVLIGLGLVARFALRRVVPPRFLFAGWLLLAASMLLPWRVSVPWHLWGAAPIESAPRIVSRVDETSEATRLVRLPVSLVEPTPVRESRIAVPPPQMVNFAFLGQSVWMPRVGLVGLGTLWLTGVAGLLLMRVVALRRLARALRRTRYSVAVRLSEAVQAEASALGVKKTPGIVVTSLVETPALCGLMRPKLLFPVGFEARVSANELAWVVRHELAHWQRRDTWAQAWMQVACAVHWFNPLVWLAARVAREDGELACDEAVLRRHAGTEDARQAYGETLLSVIGGAQSAPRLPAAVGIVESQRQLMKRIIQIAAHRPPTLLRTLLGVALLTGVVAVGATQAPTPAAVSAAESAKPAPTNVPAETLSLRSVPPREISAKEKNRIERIQAERAQWEENVVYKLEGIGRVAGEPVAIISLNGNLCAVTADVNLLRYLVTDIDVEKGQVTLTHREKPPLVLTLTTSDPIEVPEISDQQIELLLSTKERIRDMREFRVGDLMMVWNDVNREGQIRALTSYLKVGFAVGLIPQAGEESYSNVLAKEIGRRNEMRRDAFIASLTPEQRARFNAPQQAIRLKASPAEREKLIVAGKAVQSSRDEVVANLTSEQRALYDEWMSWMGMPTNLPGGR